MLSLTSEMFQPGQMYDVASTIMQQKLSQVPGVGQVRRQAAVPCPACAWT